MKAKIKKKKKLCLKESINSRVKTVKRKRKELATEQIITTIANGQQANGLKHAKIYLKKY